MGPLAPPANMSLGESLDEFMSEFSQEIDSVDAGVGVIGEAAAYALVWELGNVRQTKPGPKTTLGVNLATGERVWLTIQAPTGYVRTNEALFWQIIKKRLGALDLSGKKSDEIKQALKDTSVACVKDIAEIIRNAAPIDKGTLREQIQVIMPGDELLTQSDMFSDATAMPLGAAL